MSSVTTADPPKRNVFKRERELNGVLRTYKVRMLPTPEQRQELKLFSQRMESAASRYRGRHVITNSDEPGRRKHARIAATSVSV